MKNQYLIGLSKLRYMKINILLLRSSSSLFGENLNTRNVCECGVGGGKIFISKFTGDSITSIKRRRGKIVFSWEKLTRRRKKWKVDGKTSKSFIVNLLNRSIVVMPCVSLCCIWTSQQKVDEIEKYTTKRRKNEKLKQTSFYVRWCV